MLTAAEITVLEHNINNVWSLGDYLAHMNEQARAEMAANPGLWCSEFTEDLAHWNECGIHTARDLANYLDACFEKEVRKSAWDYPEEEPVSEAELVSKHTNVQGGATLGDIWPA